jgi:hypothetical protein
MFLFILVINNAYSQIVVICTGEYAKVYHSKENCTGLNNCKSEIIKVLQRDAVNKYKLQRPCCVCWYPSPIGCATDDMPIKNQATKFNPYVPAFSSDEEMKLYAYANAKKKEEETRAMAAGAILIAASGVGLLIVSNDFYVHKIFSLQNDPNNTNNISSNAIDFGFRIRFKNSAFEYGTTIYDEKINEGRIISNGILYDNYISTNTVFGYNIAFNQNISKLRNGNNKTKIYIGAGLNGIFTKNHFIGYSGQIGFNFDLLKRIKLDTRIEVGNYTSEIKTGIIFNYKKRKDERYY